MDGPVCLLQNCKDCCVWKKLGTLFRHWQRRNDFHRAIPIGFQIANQKQEGALKL
jgi:hypothetical protein